MSNILNRPEITWYIENDQGITPASDFYAGSYRQGDNIDLIIYLWNNRWGSEDVMDITNLVLKIFFDRIENNYLLSNCTYSVDGSSQQPVSVDNGAGYIYVSKIIKGTKNDGSQEHNSGNYIRVKLTIPIIEGISENLKSFYISPSYKSGGNN